MPGGLCRIEIVLADQVYVDRKGLSPSFVAQLIRLAAFQNPEFYRAQAMRLPTRGEPRIIHCAELHQRHVALPRGCLDETVELLKSNGTRPRITDERQSGTVLPVSFLGTLHDVQAGAAAALQFCDFGVLAATTAFGKTVVGAKMIAARGVNTLVLVHRRELLNQWRERLRTCSETPCLIPAAAHAQWPAEPLLLNPSPQSRKLLACLRTIFLAVFRGIDELFCSISNLRSESMSPKDRKSNEAYNQLEAGSKRATPIQHQRAVEIQPFGQLQPAKADQRFLLEPTVVMQPADTNELRAQHPRGHRPLHEAGEARHRVREPVGEVARAAAGHVLGRAERLASNDVLWTWIDTHEKELGIGRPYRDRDAPHVGPLDGREYLAHRVEPKSQAGKASLADRARHGDKNHQAENCFRGTAC